MEKPLMRSLKDSHSGISQTTVCSFVHSFFHVVSNSLHIPWGRPQGIAPTFLTGRNWHDDGDQCLWQVPLLVS